MKRILLSLLVIAHFAGVAQNTENDSKKTTVKDIRRTNPFAAHPNPNDPITYKNPVIPGFYSDPSICRVGEDYYLITSTFEYFPGVPVFHSKDLVNWEQIGHCIHRKEQLPNGINIFAATIRYHKGIFYMITTNVVNGGNFYVTSTNPAGPWSDPIWVDIPGIDPDLFFDGDGKSYVISSPFILYEIDLSTGKLLTEGRKVWNGTGGRYSEGPHIYKKDGFYYLMGAEGGTEEAHSETIARSHDIWGPYTDNPANPILAHANAAGQGNPIQGVGHADMIEAHDGSRWVVFHGYRDISGMAGGVHHILGRETCLAPVTWPKNGWPVINGNGTVNMNMTVPTLPLKPFPEKPKRTDFNNDKLGLEFNYLHMPQEANYTLDSRKGVLRLKGSDLVIGDEGSPTFVGRRLQHLDFTASTKVDFDPKNENEEAGVILLNNDSHFDLLIHRKNGKRILQVNLQFGSTNYSSKTFELKPGPVTLRVKGERTSFTFSYSQGNGEFTDIESVDAKFLSSETVGWFTGVYVGMYATGNGKKSKEIAFFDWFEYEGK
ncbi:glycoside hydrolase family 43 protein [Maribacter sp. TH_r10]|uniref:glycoside hydrolase family 43 protein n=1 Tax=Maribacter sp. TH_r10 TaxID=3082086 RepID=UPI002953C937|nr:glycoside hydrolase family 43 protein [Maribacter sp. TH_r10]MDV7137281.1 glycoside hydrolase family 43 protein [Maribacter sp. TH_r10]